MTHTPTPISMTPWFPRASAFSVLLGLVLLSHPAFVTTTSAFSLTPTDSFTSSSTFTFRRHSPGRKLIHLKNSCGDSDENDFVSHEKVLDDGNNDLQSNNRRKLVRSLAGIASAILAGNSAPSSAGAGEVGARITKAVTTSDLGISVRTSVVKGAQFADKLDGQWEKFSDKYGLGSERTKGQRELKIIPDPLPLNTNIAQKILDASDDVFLELMPSMTTQRLNSRIEKIATSARASFERSGVEFSLGDHDSPTAYLQFQTAPQYNFVVYAHFKAYSELIVESGSNINFASFRTGYERNMGKQLVQILQLDTGKSSSTAQEQQSGNKLKSQLLAALAQTDTLARRLREYGLVSNVDRNNIEGTDDLQDFVDDALVELVLTVSIDGDVTLQSQILLQEQGYRLYPNFNRYVVTELFQEAIQTGPQQSNADHKVSAIDYYFDTNYNSDPDKFEVKQVLLNISIE